MDIKIDNYHPRSIELEQRYLEELTIFYGDLIEHLNEIQKLTKTAIDDAIIEWRKTNWDAIKKLTEEHVNNLNEYSDEIIPANETERTKRKDVSALITANQTMLDVTTDHIKQKFIELGVLESKYGYTQEMSDDFLDKIVNSAYSSLETFVVMSTISDLKELLFGNALYNGATEYEWITQRDNKVRETHRAMDGTWVRFDDPMPMPARHHVGMDYNCRCYIGAVR